MLVTNGSDCPNEAREPFNETSDARGGKGHKGRFPWEEACVSRSGPDAQATPNSLSTTTAIRTRVADRTHCSQRDADRAEEDERIFIVVCPGGTGRCAHRSKGPTESSIPGSPIPPRGHPTRPGNLSTISPPTSTAGQRTRRSETYGSGRLTDRLGGDDCCLLLSQIAAPTPLKVKADRLDRGAHLRFRRPP
jgi:hypothetical protein